MNNLKLIHQGKVRDLYNIENFNDRLLMVASDRISAFDVIFKEKIIGKGEVLTDISNFWFIKTEHIIANHLTNEKPPIEFAKRAVVVKKLKPLPIEAIIRGYIIGSGWKDYQKFGKICDIKLPKNLQLAQKLKQPIYSPSSKANIGEHDKNISFAKTINLIGQDLAEQVRDVSLKLYNFASDYADIKNIIIADTKFEFGLDEFGKLVLMDEILTPDSSRFWDKNNYQIGLSPKSFDKQILRDYLNSLKWNKQSPAPKLPDDIIQKISKKYQQIRRILCD